MFDFDDIIDIIFIILVFVCFLFLYFDISNSHKEKMEIIKNSENYIIYDKCYDIDSNYYCMKEG